MEEGLMTERLINLPEGYEKKFPNSFAIKARESEDMFLTAGGKPNVDYTFMDCFNIAYKHELWNSVDLVQSYLCDVQNELGSIVLNMPSVI